MLVPRFNRRLLASMAVASILVPLPIILPSVVEANRYLVTPEQVVGEDMYVVSNSAVVEGLIDGDLVIASNSVVISGTVTGDVLVVSLGDVTVTGEVAGSVRGFARRIEVSGSVGDELAVAAASVGVTGSVGRDILAVSGSLDLQGSVGRDVRGRFLSLDLNGAVGRDVDVAVQSSFGGRSFLVGPSASIEGDLQYRSGREVDVDPGAVITGLTTSLPTRPAFSTEIILRIARVLTFMGFVLGGLAIFWLFRATAPQARRKATSRPWAALGMGVAVVVLLPTAGVALAATLVGIPLALLMLFGWLLALFFGPMPALAAWGSYLLRDRGGVYGGFVVGAFAMFGLLWLWSPLGIVTYLAALVVGIGSWALSSWEHRARYDAAEADEPGEGGAESGEDWPDWEPPLPPAPPSAELPPPPAG